MWVRFPRVVPNIGPKT